MWSLLDGSSTNYINYHFVIEDCMLRVICHTTGSGCNGTYRIGGNSKSALIRIERNILTTLVPVVSNKKTYLVELNGTSGDISVSLQVNHTASKLFGSCSVIELSCHASALLKWGECVPTLTDKGKIILQLLTSLYFLHDQVRVSAI